MLGAQKIYARCMKKYMLSAQEIYILSARKNIHAHQIYICMMADLRI